LSRAYSNANQDEFFQAMNDQLIIEGVSLPASIKTIMDTWTLQMGFPVVNITRDYQTGAITFEQANNQQLLMKFIALKIKTIYIN